MSDDLAEAEGWFAYWQTVGTQTRDHEERKAARLLQREFDRRGLVEQAATTLVGWWEGATLDERTLVCVDAPDVADAIGALVAAVRKAATA